MKRYYVSVRFRSKWGVDAENEKAAEVLGRLTLADAIIKGILAIDLSKPQELVECDGCDELVTDDELHVHEERKLCTECLF